MDSIAALAADPPPRAAKTMHFFATALLVAMCALYIVAVINLGHAPYWAYVKAFAEAAMVGGLADWFAVTAIFRRPLGLPIPHTAVIPRSKARIADALGQFVAINFLAPQVVSERLSTQDLAGGLGRQLADPLTARRIADGAMDALPAIVDLLDDEAVSDFLRRQATQFSQGDALPAALGRGLKLLTDHGRHEPLLDAGIREAWRALGENEAAIRRQVRGRTSWVFRLISLDARAADAMIGAIEDTLQAVAADPNHPARERVTEMLHNLSDALQNSPELRAQIEHAAADMLAHPAVGAYLATLWSDAKIALRQAAEAPDSDARRALGEAIARFGEALLADAEVQASINRRLRALLTEVAARHGRDISRLISEIIRGWDSKTIVEKLEQNVGPDLQYIRINGTIIGGLVGLAIHQATLLLSAAG